MKVRLKWLLVPLSPFLFYGFIRFFWLTIGGEWTANGTHAVGLLALLFGPTIAVGGLILHQIPPR